ncbi:MAG: hypothetical protein SOR95_08155 [Sutterella sp.]|nr:hypothetical protein [Sutterella sp.]
MANEITLLDNQLSYKAPDQKQLLAEANAAYGDATFVEIVDTDSLNYATNVMNACNKRIKELDAMRKQITRPMDEAKKAIMALFAPAIDRYTDAVAVYKRGISDYMREQQRKAEEERRRAQEEARKQQEILQAALQQVEDPVEASVIQEAMAVTAVTVPQAPKIEKPAGAVIRKKYKGNVVDLKAFLHFVADHPEYHSLVTIRQGDLDRLVGATAGALSIAGVEVTEESIVACKG